jgi:hypothetical protein
MYLKYMLLHPKRFSDTVILEACEYAQLDALGVTYLRRLRLSLRPPAEFHPFDEYHWPSQQYLLEQGLHRIFFPDKRGKKAFELLRKPRAKEFIEAMAMLNAPTAAVARIVTRDKGVPCVAQDIDTYLSFFWDLSLVDSTEMRALIKLRVSHSQFSGEDVEAQMEALQGTYWGDARKIASDLPSSPWSAMIAQMRMGLMPEHVDLGQATKGILNVLVAKIMESACGSGARDAERVVAYTTALKALREVESTLAPPEELLRKQMAALGVRTNDERIPTILEVTAGNHTTQMLPSNLLRGEGGDDDDDAEDDHELQ